MLDRINIYSEFQGKISKNSINALGKGDLCEFTDYWLKYIIDETSISIEIKNKDKRINLKKVELIMRELNINEFSHFIQSPEFVNNEFTKKDIKELDNEKYISHFFTVFNGKDEIEHILVGFLNSKSRNYIKIRKENDKIYHCLTYDFINHIIEPNITLILDKACFIEKNKEYELYSEYVKRIRLDNNIDLNRDYCKIKESKISLDKTDELFYLENKEKFILANKDGGIKKKINNKKKYLINITDERGKDEIIRRVKEETQGKPCIYKISVRDYIETIIENKKFNVYGAINDMIKNIFKELDGIIIKAEDFPLGLAITNVNLLEKKICVEKNKGFINKFFRKSSIYNDVNIELFYSIMLYSQLFNHSFNYDVSDEKIKDKLNFISKDFKSKESLHTNVACKELDLSFDDKLGIYFKKEDVFSIWRYNDNKLYIGAFNFSKDKQKLYIDIGQYSNCKSTDGKCASIIKEEEQILIKNKLYLKKIKERSSIIFEKVI